LRGLFLRGGSGKRGETEGKGRGQTPKYVGLERSLASGPVVCYGQMKTFRPTEAAAIYSLGHGLCTIVVKFELFELYYWLEVYELYYK